MLAAAYKALARKYHPDRHPDKALAERRMARLNEAWEVLGDPLRRERYDQERLSAPGRGAVPPPPSYSGRWGRARVLDSQGRGHEVSLLALDWQGARVRCRASLNPKQELRLQLSLGLSEAPLVVPVRVAIQEGEHYLLRYASAPDARLTAYLNARR